MHKERKCAKKILVLQDDEGKWGCFHSLSQFYDSSITTEQALRRLEVLGYSIDDPCIQNAVQYMEDCLDGRKLIPDRREKVTDWDVFSRLILATWIRRFTHSSILANQVAEQWSYIVTEAFSSGSFDEFKYVACYRDVLQPQYGRINGLSMFYPVSLLRNCLDPSVEQAMVDYLLSGENGIYYIYDHKLTIVPYEFQSREASRYLGAIELMADFPTAREKLGFVVDWLVSNQKRDGIWDMGNSVNDKVYFPLSDDWRRSSVREADCTERIVKLIHKLT